jgi:glycosyltransferase involved in cell wall biosynthesis
MAARQCLIPSRNEEKNLPRCLYSVNKLDYPLDKLEIILGDDRSGDRTWEILEDWQRQKDHVHIMKISEGNPEK